MIHQIHHYFVTRSVTRLGESPNSSLNALGNLYAQISLCAKLKSKTDSLGSHVGPADINFADCLKGEERFIIFMTSSWKIALHFDISIYRKVQSYYGRVTPI